MNSVRKPHLFQPGQSGNPGGKPKSRLKRIDEMLAKEDLHPITEILRLINHGELKDRDKLQAWLEIMSYTHAKPKEMPVSEEDDLSHLSTAELVTLVKDKLDDLGKTG